jgi:hypothetical protein
MYYLRSYSQVSEVSKSMEDAFQYQAKAVDHLSHLLLERTYSQETGSQAHLVDVTCTYRAA